MLRTKLSLPSLLAVASLIVGAVSLCFMGLGGMGILALPLGWLAVRGINESEGRLWGRNLAIAGIVLGATATALTVFGVLAQIVLPVWQASTRTQCLNNLREIGLAVNKYEAAGQNAPRGVRFFPQAAVANPQLPPASRLSWLVEILPHVESANPRRSRLSGVLDKIDLDQAWDSPANQVAAHTNVPLFRCPSLPIREPVSGLSTYVGLSGVDPDAAFLPKDHPRAGPLGFDRRVSRNDFQAGLSYTLLALETTSDNGSWLAAGTPTLRGVDPHDDRYIGLENHPFGGCHRSGANAVFMDGSAKFIRDNVEPVLIRSMATLTGAEPER